MSVGLLLATLDCSERAAATLSDAAASDSSSDAVASALDVAEAGFSVGYDSPSQFSRDYRRLFGAPPLRETRKLKASLLGPRDHSGRPAAV